jgi:hypothetical protein
MFMRGEHTVKIDSGLKRRPSKAKKRFVSFAVFSLLKKPPRRFGSEVDLSADEERR